MLLFPLNQNKNKTSLNDLIVTDSSFYWLFKQSMKSKTPDVLSIIDLQIRWAWDTGLIKVNHNCRCEIVNLYLLHSTTGRGLFHVDEAALNLSNFVVINASTTGIRLPFIQSLMSKITIENTIISESNFFLFLRSTYPGGRNR